MTKKSKKPRSCKRFSRQEDRLIKRIYPTFGGVTLLVGKLQRNHRSIVHRAARLGVKSGYRISSKELEVIRERYPKEGASAEIQKLLGVSKDRIIRAAIRHGISVDSGFFNRLFVNGLSPKFTGYEQISGTHFSCIRNNAKARNIKFNVTLKYIWDLFVSQKRLCALSGLALEFATRAGKYDGTVSLDRINSNRGYVKGNVQWVHKDVNYMKQDLDEQSFIQYCFAIAEHQTQLNP